MSLECTLVAPLWVSASSAATWKSQVTNSSHPCCRGHRFPPRRDCKCPAPWDIRCMMLPQELVAAAAWSSTHEACESMSVMKAILPEGPSPPSIPIKVIREITPEISPSGEKKGGQVANRAQECFVSSERYRSSPEWHPHGAGHSTKL